MGSNDPRLDSIGSRKSSVGSTRRRFLTLLGAGALASAAIPEVTAQEHETGDAPDPDMGDVMVTMTDNVNLATDVYFPEEDGSFPTIVHRTPYNKGTSLTDPVLVALLDNGYAVVTQDVRGRFKSEGEWDPVFHEQEDGYDSVEWAAEQDWSTGKVGMTGHSYRAITSWQAALTNPPSLEAIAPIQGTANTYRGWQYKGGIFELGLNLTWTLGNNQIPRLPLTEETKTELRSELSNPGQLFNVLPLDQNPAFDEFVANFYNEWLLHDQYDAFWERTDVNKFIENISAKVLNIGGLYDILLEGSTAAFDSINERGQQDVRETQSMILGPWDHRKPSAAPVGERELPDNAGAVGTPEDIVRWFDQWLKDGDSGESLPPVQYYQVNQDEWRVANTWPPEDVSSTTWYLNSDGYANSRWEWMHGTLSSAEPEDGADTDSYVYDPMDPVPTTGGPTLMIGAQAGVVDQRDVERREDVLKFTSGSMEEAMDVVGIPEVTLFVESTAPDTDFSVKLVDVHPDGYAENVTEGHLKARYRETSKGESYRSGEFMEQGEVYELSIDLRSTAYTFEEEHKLRIDITSSNFPRLARSPNTTMDVGSASEDDMQTATNTIHHSVEWPSRVSIPVIEN